MVVSQAIEERNALTTEPCSSPELESVGAPARNRPRKTLLATLAILGLVAVTAIIAATGPEVGAAAAGAHLALVEAGAVPGAAGAAGAAGVWRVHNRNGSIDVPAALPGSAHEALLRAGVLVGDPLWRDNELRFRWVALEDWTFTCTFLFAPSHPLLGAAALLRLDGVDTVADVRLNGELVGRTESMFVRYTLALRPGLLRAGSNALTLGFTSALSYAASRAAAYPYAVPHTQYHHVWSEPSLRNFVRKPPSDFGWDWCDPRPRPHPYPLPRPHPTRF